MDKGHTTIRTILYDAMIDAGYDEELSNHAAAFGGDAAMKILDCRAQDAFRDRYIADVIERARVATLAGL